MLTLSDVIEALTDYRPKMATVSIFEAVIDSRQAMPGTLFTAIVGENTDGHNFVFQAYKNGAIASLIERSVDSFIPATHSGLIKTIDVRTGFFSPEDLKKLQSYQPDQHILLLVENTVTALQKIAAFWRRKLSIRVIGITGSVGKSTTKEAIFNVLSQKYSTLKSAGNLNNEIGLPMSVLKLTSEHQYAVLEMGFYVPGEIKLLCDIALPHVGVITNIGSVHAERAGSREVIASGKAELVQELPASPEGIAVLNFDDPYVRPMDKKTRAKVFYYGLTPEADLWADEITSNGLEGIQLRLHYKADEILLKVPMLGRHSAETILRAAAVGLIEGLTWDEITRGLTIHKNQLRLNAVQAQSGATLIDDTYNASPESTLAAINLLGDLAGNKIAVLGDMLELGQYEQEGHEMVGSLVAQTARTLVTLGPRAKIIAQAARKAGMQPEKIHEYQDIQDVINWLKNNLTNIDTVLVKGSNGLHMERIIRALEAAK